MNAGEPEIGQAEERDRQYYASYCIPTTDGLTVNLLEKYGMGFIKGKAKIQQQIE